MSLEWPLPLRKTIQAPIRSVLLVAGPSGSGKSTFLDQFRLGTLPEDIRVELPPGCESWMEVAFLNFVPFFNAWPKSQRIDIVLHYDTRNAHLRGWSSFFEDPRLQAISRADAVVAVTLRPTPEQLSAQFARRVFGGNTPAEKI